MLEGIPVYLVNIELGQYINVMILNDNIQFDNANRNAPEEIL